MADSLIGKVWTLGSGTLGAVVSTPVMIDKIRITWSTASAGNVQLDEVNQHDLTAAGPILIAKTIDQASHHGFITQEFDMGGATFQGLTKSAMTGVSGETGVQIQLK